MVPPGEGWTHDPYGGEIVDGRLYGRAAAVSKSDFATYTFAVRALEVARRRRCTAGSNCCSPTTRSSAANSAPAGCCEQGLTKPDFLIAAGFSYQVITAHNGCLQMEVTVHGKMAHAAIPDTGVDALQGAVAILNALYAQNALYQQVTLEGRGHHPPLPERRPHRRRHQHQRRARQGACSSSTGA